MGRFAEFIEPTEGVVLPKPAGRFSGFVEPSPGSAQANLALTVGAESNPDEAAGAAKLARRYQVPPAVAEMFRKDFENKAKVEDGRRALESAPKLRDFIAQNPESAKVLHDDIEGMGALEIGFAAFKKAWGVGMNVRDSIASAVPSVASGLAGVATAGFDIAYDAQKKLFETFGRDAPFGDESPSSRIARRVAVATKQTAEEWMPKGGHWAEQAAYSGIQSAASTVMLAPLGAVGVIGGLSAVTGGQSYIKATEFDPADPTKKVLGHGAGLGYAVIDAAIEAGTEFLPMKKLFKDFAAGSGFGKMLLHNLLYEVPTEFAATFGQSFNEWAMLHPDQPIQTWIDSLPQAMKETFVATMVGGTAQVGAMKAAQKALQRFDNKQATAAPEIDAHAALDDVAALAKASKTLGRDAQAFQQAVEPMTDGSVYIDAKAFAAAAEAAGIKPSEAALTSNAVSDQFESAFAEGRDIEIPMAEFAAMQQQPFAEALLDSVRLRADGPTRAELTAQATDADGLKTEVDAAVRDVLQPSEDQKFEASASRVMEAEVKKMTELGRFNEHQNKLYATASSAFYAQQARRLGITPEQAQQQYPFFVAREGQGDLAQSPGNDVPETIELTQRRTALEQLAECLG